MSIFSRICAVATTHHLILFQFQPKATFPGINGIRLARRLARAATSAGTGTDAVVDLETRLAGPESTYGYKYSIRGELVHITLADVCATREKSVTLNNLPFPNYKYLIRGDDPDQKLTDSSKFKLVKPHEHFATAIDDIARKFSDEKTDLPTRLDNSWQYLLEFISVFVPHLFGDSDSSQVYQVLNGVPLIKGRHDVFIGFFGMRYGRAGSLDAHEDSRTGEYGLIEQILGQRFAKPHPKPMIHATYVPTTDIGESGGDYKFEMHSDPAVLDFEDDLNERITAALEQRVIPVTFQAREDAQVSGTSKAKHRDSPASLADSGIMQCNGWVGDLGLPNCGVRNLELFTGQAEKAPPLHPEIDLVLPSIDGRSNRAPLTVTLFNPLHTHRGVMWQRALHNYMVAPACQSIDRLSDVPSEIKDILAHSGQAQRCLFNEHGCKRHPINAGQPLFKTGIDFSEFSTEIRSTVVEQITEKSICKDRDVIMRKFGILSEILTHTASIWERDRKFLFDNVIKEGCRKEVYKRNVSSYIALVLVEDALFGLAERRDRWRRGMVPDLTCPSAVSAILRKNMGWVLTSLGVPDDNGLWETIFGIAHKHVILNRERYKELRQLTEYGISMEFRMIIVDKEHCKKPKPSASGVLAPGSNVIKGDQRGKSQGKLPWNKKLASVRSEKFSMRSLVLDLLEGIRGSLIKITKSL